MRILVDEDLGSDELLDRLRAIARLDVVTAARGSTDEEVWDLAQAEEAAILTGNVRDFLRLGGERPDHHGLLVVYRRNDASRDLKFVDIAGAVAVIVAEYPGSVAGQVVVVNAYAAR